MSPKYNFYSDSPAFDVAFRIDQILNVVKRDVSEDRAAADAADSYAATRLFVLGIQTPPDELDALSTAGLKEYRHWKAQRENLSTIGPTTSSKPNIPAPLSKANQIAWDRAMKEVLFAASQNIHKRPKFTTLLEEMTELTLALRGKHDHPAELELIQIASVALNLLAQVYMGELDYINNARTTYHEDDSQV